MGHSKHSPERKIHSIRGIPQETRKISYKKFNPIPKITRERTTKKAQSKQKEGNNQDDSGNK